MFLRSDERYAQSTNFERGLPGTPRATAVLPAPTIIMDVVRNSIECFLDDHPYDGIFMFLTVPRLERSLDMTFEELCQELKRKTNMLGIVLATRQSPVHS